MKFSISSTELARAIQHVIGVVPNRSTIPILSNLLFSSEEGQIKIVATDLEITLISWAVASISEEGETTIPARIINDIIRELPETNMNFTVDADNRITIKTASGEYKISGEAKDEFPSIHTDHGRKRESGYVRASLKKNDRKKCFRLFFR